jgi:hypothetical protein
VDTSSLKQRAEVLNVQTENLGLSVWSGEACPNVFFYWTSLGRHRRRTAATFPLVPVSMRTVQNKGAWPPFEMFVLCQSKLVSGDQSVMNILTAMIAVITVSILVLQYRLERSRWRLALYDKRYPIFNNTMVYITDVIKAADVTTERNMQFLRETKSQELLFGPEVATFLTSLYKKGVELSTTTTIADAPRIDEEKRKKLIEKQQTIVLWFGDQLQATKDVFEPYLRISKK